jgi:prevent-host-death family protein
MKTAIDLNDAQAQFDQLVERVERGEEIIITRDGRPVARMIPYRRDPGPRPPGSTATSPPTMGEIVERADELPRRGSGARDSDVIEVIRAGRDQPGAPGDDDHAGGAG